VLLFLQLQYRYIKREYKWYTYILWSTQNVRGLCDLACRAPISFFYYFLFCFLFLQSPTRRQATGPPSPVLPPPPPPARRHAVAATSSSQPSRIHPSTSLRCSISTRRRLRRWPRGVAPPHGAWTGKRHGAKAPHRWHSLRPHRPLAWICWFLISWPESFSLLLSPRSALRYMFVQNLISLLYCTISCENILDVCFPRLRFFPFVVLWIKLFKNEVANNLLSHCHCLIRRRTDSSLQSICWWFLRIWFLSNLDCVVLYCIITVHKKCFVFNKYYRYYSRINVMSHYLIKCLQWKCSWGLCFLLLEVFILVCRYIWLFNLWL